MELSSSGLHDRLGSIGKGDLSPQKEKEECVQNKPTDSGDTEQMIQRCVIIQKDEKGYGLTVSGDNPVFVQSVKEDGAAARAGVLQGDRIIKVNGTLVTQSNHQDVVELIKSGSYVALTLLGKPPGHGRSSSGTVQPLNLSGSGQTHTIHVGNKSTSPSERITGPQPVDPEKQQQLTNSRIHTIRKMLEKEVIYLDNLRMEFSKTPSEKIRAEVNGAMKRVKTLEEQLTNLTGIPHDQIIPRSPRSPPPAGRHYHSDKDASRRTSSPVTSHSVRGLTHQISTPILPSKSDRYPTLVLSPGDSSEPSAPAITSLQDSQNSEIQSPTSHKKPSISSSLENIAKQFSSKSTTWPQVGPTHSRQASSPETLMQQVENLRYQKNEDSRSSPSETLCRSHSEASKHSYSRKCHAPESVSEAENRKRRRKTTSSRGSSVGQYDSAIESPIPSPPLTPPEYAEVQGDLGESFEGEDPVLQEEYGTPPENSTSEVNMQSVATKLSQNLSIICMEDDDFPSDTEMGHLEDHGPFNGLWKLVRNPAHLAVFTHFLMSNGDPSSLFFYLITDMYEQGTLREMKKWAYEIHSSFMVPGAPLKVKSVDEAILLEIDDVLLNQIEKEEVLRAVFRKARKKAREELNDLLADFRNKRTMGLANIFGPPDYQLDEALHDKNKEIKIIEQLLVPCLENLASFSMSSSTFFVFDVESVSKYSDDIDNANEIISAKAVALATILKQFGVNSQSALKLVEKCPTFVAKERSRIRFLQKNKKVANNVSFSDFPHACPLSLSAKGNKLTQNAMRELQPISIMFVQGHHFLPQHYCSVTYCNHCQLIIWGVGHQGYQCQNCEMNIHKLCVKVVEEHCIGALRKKDKMKDRMSGIVENFIAKTRKPSHPVPAAIEKARKLNEEANSDPNLPSLYNAENVPEQNEKSSDGRVEKVNETNEISYQHSMRDDCDKPTIHKKTTSIGRSESFRQRRESRPSFRKRSDPNIPRSKSDVEVDDKSVSNLNNSGSSSNSSISNRSLDSPSNSSEMVHRTPTVTSADSVPAGSTPTTGVPSSQASTPSTVHHYDDSDLEAEADPPNWQENVDWDVLKLMKPKEKKRQDVINELFHTERTHVRNLKVLDKLFHKPLLQSEPQLLPPDFLQLLFPNLDEMLEIHGNFNSKIKARRKEEAIIGDIGLLMLEMFDGAAGEHLKKAAATYCQNQSFALENLKTRQRKDQKLSQFISDAESHHLCRRLQLKDIIASGFQRLTKYPLLLENIAKYTPPNTEELTNLQKAVECSKDILVYVDSAVKEAENMHRLTDIQKKLDKSAFEKVEHPIVHSFKNFDVTKHRLLHEGPLMWRMNKQKTIDMHVVLFEDVLVLLQKQDEKYVLKFHTTNVNTGREDTKILHSPILRVHNLLIRNNATDKRSIFLISSSELHAMYEFVASTASEKKIWCKHLTEAVEVKKTQSGTMYKPPEPPEQPQLDHVLSTEGSTEVVESPSKEGPPEMNDIQDAETRNDSSETPIPKPFPDSIAVLPSAPPLVTPEGQQNETTSPSSTSDDAAGSESRSIPQRRLQRVEVLKIADEPQLIEPCEVIVSHGAILETAEPVLTPIEKLRRKDQQIDDAVKEKEHLVADILQIPVEHFHHVANLADEMEEEKDAQELALASIYQANQLVLCVNECLNIKEEDAISASTIEVPAESEEHFSSSHLPHAAKKSNRFPGVPASKLKTISCALNKHLTQLLSVITEIENERRQLRKELHNCKEQMHLFHETHRQCIVPSHSPSSYSICQSRPSSFISIASSMSEGTPELPEHQHFFTEKTSEELIPGNVLATDSSEAKPKVLSELPVLNENVISSDTEKVCCELQNSEKQHSVNLSSVPLEPVTDLDCDLCVEKAGVPHLSGDPDENIKITENSSGQKEMVLIENQNLSSELPVCSRTEETKVPDTVNTVYF